MEWLRAENIDKFIGMEVHHLGDLEGVLQCGISPAGQNLQGALREISSVERADGPLLQVLFRIFMARTPEYRGDGHARLVDVSQRLKLSGISLTHRDAVPHVHDGAGEIENGGALRWVDGTADKDIELIGLQAGRERRPFGFDKFNLETELLEQKSGAVDPNAAVTAGLGIDLCHRRICHRPDADFL